MYIFKTEFAIGKLQKLFESKELVTEETLNEKLGISHVQNDKQQEIEYGNYFRITETGAASEAYQKGANANQDQTKNHDISSQEQTKTREKSKKI